MGHWSGVIPESGKISEMNNWPRSAHEARRFILGCIPDSEALEGLPERDIYGRGDEPAKLEAPELVEGSKLVAIHVADPRHPDLRSNFGGFLDGTQDVRKVSHHHGIPIVWATVSAAVRKRVDRRLVAWPERAPIVRGSYYIPFRYVDALSDTLRHHPRAIDTTAHANSKGVFPSRHPAALTEAAVKAIQRDREVIETELADAWCSVESSPLYVDGGISGSAVVAVSPLAIGIVKSHHRLYADEPGFRVLVNLAAGERTSVFRITRNDISVASWYVRTRSAKGRDAFFGLVRVEAALTDDISTRADEVSRWILAEGAPLALPDGRWDKMAYGIRDTEEFLRAIS